MVNIYYGIDQTRLMVTAPTAQSKSVANYLEMGESVAYILCIIFYSLMYMWRFSRNYRIHFGQEQ